MKSYPNDNILQIQETTNTPYVCFDKSKGLLKLSGRSYPEHAKGFYDHLNNWIDNYLQNPSSKTCVEISFDYINSSSTKALMFLMKKFQKLYNKGKEVSVHWFYKPADEEMYEVGQIFSDNINIPFQFYKC